MGTQQREPRGLDGLPPRGRGIANWYGTRQAGTHVCRDCLDSHAESPTVLEYLPELDHGRAQARKHPGWDQTHWLAWWDCPTCGYQDFEVVTAAQVAKWGRALGGWKATD